MFHFSALKLRASFRARTPWSGRRREAAAVEHLEERTLLSASRIGGVGNNLLHPTWGTAGSTFLRTAPAEYEDGVSTPAGANRPSARAISNAVADDGDGEAISDRLMSAMIYAWGQFLDHDIDLTNTGGTEKVTAAVPKGDPFFDPLGTGTKTISTTRSVFDPTTGTSAANPRQQVNAITAFIDGSMVYGSDAATAASLRTFVGGKLKTGAGNLLPTDPTSGPAAMFLAGDVRANENAELIAMQTLFLREHNFQAGRIAAQNPSLSDLQIYDKARERVIAEIQAITYNEWLPALLGPGAIGPYKGYNAKANPGIANEFATAAFRLGHSLLGDDIEFLDNNGVEIREGVALAEAFFNPGLVRTTGIDPILKYLASDPSSELDTRVVDGVRNFLFGPPGAGGLDLATLNILRGRDHGLADYNTVRAAYGLPKLTSFSQITSDPQLAAELKKLYGSVDDVDLWVGGLAENHVPGGSVGITFRTILKDQFERLRGGDRFWYQNQLTGNALKEVQSTTLADVIRRNTTLTNLQQNTFFFRASVTGQVYADTNANGRRDVRETGAARVKVELIDAEGEVVATTKTDGAGRYRFTVEDGLRTGKYQVRLRLADGTAGPATKAIAITRGEQSLNVPDLAVAVASQAGTSRTPKSRIAGGSSSGGGSVAGCPQGGSTSVTSATNTAPIAARTSENLPSVLTTASKAKTDSCRTAAFTASGFGMSLLDATLGAALLSAADELLAGTGRPA